MKLNKVLPTLSKSLCGMLLLSGALFAAEADEPRTDHIPVGEREMCLADRIACKEARLMNIENEEGDDSVAPVAKKVAKGATYYTTHEGAYHRPYAVSYLGDSVELEDGSIWSVYSGDRWKTLDWMTGDLVIILPNSSLFSVFDYRLLNVSTGANVKVNLSLGPIFNGVYTHWILAIDHFTQEICLEDGTIWSMSAWDSSITSNWLPNDTIIIGINDGFLSGSNPNMLINVNTNNSASGSCIY